MNTLKKSFSVYCITRLATVKFQKLQLQKWLMIDLSKNLDYIFNFLLVLEKLQTLLLLKSHLLPASFLGQAASSSFFCLNNGRSARWATVGQVRSGDEAANLWVGSRSAIYGSWHRRRAPNPFSVENSGVDVRALMYHKSLFFSFLNILL